MSTMSTRALALAAIAAAGLGGSSIANAASSATTPRTDGTPGGGRDARRPFPQRSCSSSGSCSCGVSPDSDPAGGLPSWVNVSVVTSVVPAVASRSW
jgi:hypothetical protein